MSFASFYKNHNDASVAHARRALGETRAVLPSSHKVYDAQMGQVALVGDVASKEQEGAWAGMTQMMPLEKKDVNSTTKAARPREEILASMREQMRAPAYDAQSEERRAAKTASQREAWESSECTSLPGASTIVKAAPPKSSTAAADSPFATSLTTRPRDCPAPRGRARIVPAQSKDDATFRRSRGPGLPPSKEPSPDASFVSLKKSSRDESAYAIGNCRAESFVLTSKPTRRILSATNKLPSEERDQQNFSRRVFQEHAGGGRSSLDSSLTAESSHRPARRFVPGANSAPEISVPTGKKRVPPPQSSSWAEEALPQVDEPSPPSSSATKDDDVPVVNSAFVEWYKHEYGEMPPPELIRRAAADINATHEEERPTPATVQCEETNNSMRASTKSRGPRGLGSDSSFSSSNRSINTGNSILGRSSTRRVEPPGGRSSISFSAM